ncbi:glycosyl hydrolase family 65 protein [Aliiglaciecola sp. CAU 1673]|uniref:glycoside hydrolase family 65 protein n=1 Tax=Aliiglaciecola sp. CAU 1673 TaxID=3032595 RepID=UPI0023DBB38F|nr:glycosyl hydrolase family 65 protein [Aliiglaciecola sp. CAU 1673]MDF2178493.1 glycosyl hydrolase family 65 protein [Aliiglaciecola sp. CAU 1673]
MKHPSPNPAFTVEPWALSTASGYQDQSMLDETLFALANGYLGTRGTAEEGAEEGQFSCEGTYLNGVYHSEEIQYGEVAYGYATHNQKMQQVPNGKVLQIFVDNEKVSQAQSLECQRRLDMQSASYQRELVWQSSQGKRLQVNYQRMASLSHPNLLCLRLEITALNFSGEISIKSILDAGYRFAANKSDPRVGQLSIADSLQLTRSELGHSDARMQHQVKDSPFLLCSGYDHHFSVPPLRTTQLDHDLQIGHQFEFALNQNKPLVVEKYVLYNHSRTMDDTTLKASHQSLMAEVRELGWDKLFAQHTEQVKAYWRNSDVVIDGDPAMQQGIRFNLLHLFMSVGKDGKSNIGAKGLTGHGYDGHYFWDTEIYILSFLSATNPALARHCLEYRYHTLDGARRRAREMSHPSGALYPWRTIGGDECSAFFPAGTAQYHINAAIAHAIKSYYLASGDWQFILEMGAEMLFETARLWLHLGHFNPRCDGRFCIDGVTGPDEYTAIVNNNFYTNAMAKAHLDFAVEVVDRFQREDSERWKSICHQLTLTEEEVALWQKAADLMYLPYDEKLGISPQDDSFLEKKPWDFANTPANQYPLLLHFHPLVIYRHQVLKQADVVLAMFLLDDAFPQELKARNLAYYEPLTTHDSTLSTCIHAIEFAETGDYEKAYEFFKDSVRMDLDNLHGNTEYGIHTACMAGSWMSIVNGFAGLRIRADKLVFNPSLPAHWRGFGFNLNCHGRHLHIQISARETRYQLLRGDNLEIEHQGKKVLLQKDQPLCLANQGDKA